MDTENVKAFVAAVKGPTLLELGTEQRAVVIPEGWSVEDISKMLPPPPRVKQRVEILTLESLVAYALAFKTPTSAIFANETDATYDVALDYHRRNAADVGPERGACDHVARYACPQSEQWTIWNANHAKAKTQLDFARFIEANLVDIVKPVSADMLQIVLNLQVHKTAEFKGDMRLDNGQSKLSYEETIRGNTKIGDLTIPDVFQLGLPVFIDGKRYAVDARLRYRLEEGKLSMWYELVRPVDVFRAAVKEVSDSLRKQLEGVPFWIGKRT
jgi:uncharacterized protein YfdQ (DUF2303 family)